MKAISITFCRDRAPGSKVAPLEPLPDELWDQLRARVTEALERIPARETETREGHTVWDGREEYCVTVSRLWVDATEEQMDALRTAVAELASQYDQDAMVLHVEERHLVLAAG